MKFFTGQPQDSIGLLSVKLQKLILFLFFANTFEFFRAGAINWLLAAATSVALTFGFVGSYRRGTGMLTCFHVFNLMYFALVLTALVLGLLALGASSRPHHAPRPDHQDPQGKEEDSSSSNGLIKPDGVAWAELDPQGNVDSSWFQEGLGMGDDSSSFFPVDDWFSGGSWFVSESEESMFDSLFLSGSEWESAFDGWFTAGTGKNDRDLFLSKFGGGRRLRNDKRIGPTRINWGDDKHMMLAEFEEMDAVAKRGHKEPARPEKPKADAAHQNPKAARKPSAAASVFVRVMVAAVVALEITAFLVKIYATLLSVRIVTMLRMQNPNACKRRSAFTLRSVEADTAASASAVAPAVAMSPMDIPMQPIPAYQPADGMWVPVQTPSGEVQFAYYPMEVVIAQQQQMMMMAMAYNNNYNTQQV